MHTKKYKQLPHSPDNLNETGKDYWRIYCHVMLDRNDLKVEYLSAIASLCYLEQQREEIESKINEHGLYNVYHKGTEDEFIQANGADKMLYKTVKEIQNLKKQLHLNPEKSNDESKKQNPILSQSKNY